ncbi:S8 family serine peptidase [Nocardioides marinquilinus]|uniref:S8 family serine peptidase n=1 Tax=Nocardioides marinquilinus TaxID=1210400 RepID=A0ABP9PAW4_9ACTN
MSPKPTRRVLAAATATAVVAGLAAAVAGPAVPAGADEADTPATPAPVRVGERLDPSLLPGSAPSAFFVRFRGSGALALDRAAGAAGRGARIAPAARARVAEVRGATRSAVGVARRADADAAVLYETSWTVPGVALLADGDAAAALAARSDVASVTPIVAKQLVEPVARGERLDEPGQAGPQNAPSNELTGASETWRATGNTGEGQVIAVIDTGVDYTHADFGGSGIGRDWYVAGRNLEMVEGTYDPDVVLPGYDFAGLEYNGASVAVPTPDANPIDGPGGGHGTHVAGTAAGRGVTADGATFTGDYATLTAGQAREMNVAPGSAPGAKIVPLKVFGDFGGTTGLAGAALEWVGRSVAEGNRIDVVNMSLGSSFSPVDDPENDMVDALVDAGVVPVISAGNSGDVTDVAGSPGNSPAGLAVAASASGFARYDTVQVLAPSELSGEGPFLAQYSQEQPPGIDIAGPVVALTEPDNLDGCDPISAEDVARIDGRILWLEWDLPTLRCGSAQRFDNADEAGAAGVVLGSTSVRFEGGIAGNGMIPGVELDRATTEKLRPALESDRLAVRMADDLRELVEQDDAALADTLASFTSRGVHGSISDVVKPDVSAPGVNVVSASVGTGTGEEMMSGTSMAAPHTAGVVALARTAHPDWTAHRIKALVMNTAAHEVTAPDGHAYSNLMQGTGRIDALAATESEVTVESVQNPDLVTASFGVVEVARDGVSEQRTLRLTNTGSDAQTFAVGWRERVATPGAQVRVSPGSVTVPAGGTAEVTVTLAVPDREALRRTLDPGQDADRLRSHVPNTSGVVTFTPAEDAATPPLQVAVFAAPKPVSDLTVTGPVRFERGRTRTPLPLAGRYLEQGAGVAAWRSRVTPLVAGTTSPRLPRAAGAADSLAGLDVLEVGATTTAPSYRDRSRGTLAVGARMAGPIVSMGVASYPVVNYDLDDDGIADFQSYAVYDRASNVAVAATVDVGTQLVVDQKPLNGLGEGNLGQWDNDTVVLPVSLVSLGFTRDTTATSIRYWVTTESQYAPVDADGNPQVVDRTRPVAFDVYQPPVWFTRGAQPSGQTAFTVRRGGSPVVVNRAPSSKAASGRLMVIAHDDATGRRTSGAGWRAPAPRGR